MSEAAEVWNYLNINGVNGTEMQLILSDNNEPLLNIGFIDKAEENVSFYLSITPTADCDLFLSSFIEIDS